MIITDRIDISESYVSINGTDYIREFIIYETTQEEIKWSKFVKKFIGYKIVEIKKDSEIYIRLENSYNTMLRELNNK